MEMVAAETMNEWFVEFLVRFAGTTTLRFLRRCWVRQKQRRMNMGGAQMEKMVAGDGGLAT